MTYLLLPNLRVFANRELERRFIKLSRINRAFGYSLLLLILFAVIEFLHRDITMIYVLLGPLLGLAYASMRINGKIMEIIHSDEVRIEEG